MLEGYRSDLQEIQLVTRSMRAQIDDTKEFINTHLVKNGDFFVLLTINNIESHMSSDQTITVTAQNESGFRVRTQSQIQGPLGLKIRVKFHG